ncbi:class I SAM-dependent methyltransferase [Streptosporangium sp. NPDC048865]|uniref:class I SAM-dependent methyltransferase n=1 Tax=Streptosporangium sp. NPDC048865 TaxID=3155766 RepID=UPI00343B2C90
MNTEDTNRPHRDHERAGAGTVALAELLDLDAEVLHDHLAELTAWLDDLTDRPPGHIVDLGSGTGTGTLALLERFPGARATALDLSPQLLHHLSKKAHGLGLAGRLDTVQADLDAAWPELAPADLVWAASSLHHMADPGQVLARAFDALRPGGLLAVTEMDFFPRFLPGHTGLGRLEARLHAALNDGPAADWTGALARAGFVLEARRPFTVDLPAPPPEATGRYARASLSRLRSHADGLLPGADLALLDTVLGDDGPDGILRRGDLTVRTTRTTWAARRP